MEGKVSITISVSPSSNPSLSVDANDVPSTAQVGTPFTGKLNVSGGNPPYSFKLTEGALPDGVSLLSDGSFSGTPTMPGDFSFTVEVSDTLLAA